MKNCPFITGKEGAEGAGIRASNISRSRIRFCATVISPVSSEMSMASSTTMSSSIMASTSTAASLPAADTLRDNGSGAGIRSVDSLGERGVGGCCWRVGDRGGYHVETSRGARGRGLCSRRRLLKGGGGEQLERERSLTGEGRCGG